MAPRKWGHPKVHKSMLKHFVGLDVYSLEKMFPPHLQDEDVLLKHKVFEGMLELEKIVTNEVHKVVSQNTWRGV